MPISAEDRAELDVTAPARRRGTASARTHWRRWANQRPPTPGMGSASLLVLGGGRSFPFPRNVIRTSRAVGKKLMA
jgi:hypothetical protein